MANVLVQDSSLTAVGNAIRAKNGSTTQYKPAEMAAAIQALGGGGELKFLKVQSKNTDGVITIKNENLPKSGTIYTIAWGRNYDRDNPANNKNGIVISCHTLPNTNPNYNYGNQAVLFHFNPDDKLLANPKYYQSGALQYLNEYYTDGYAFFFWYE